MPRSSAPVIDPVFVEIAKAIYGDVDPRELLEVAKSIPGADVLHSDTPVTTKQATDQKRLAVTGLAATGVAGVAGVHAIGATRAENATRMAAATGKELPQAAKKVGVLTRLGAKAGLSPAKTAGVIGGAALALHGVELLGDTLGAHAQVKALKQANANAAAANPNNPVSKAFRLKPLNTIASRVPSLRAKRVKLNPSPGNPATKAGVYQPVAKAKGKTVHQMTRSARAVLSPGGIAQPKVTAASAAARAKAIRAAQIERDTTMSKGLRSQIRSVKTTLANVEEASRSANTAAASAQQVTDKARQLIPTRRTAILAGAGTVAALGAATYAGGRSAHKKKAIIRYRTLQPVEPGTVAKSGPVEVTWTGVIAKVDAEHRQVFGWASVSRVNGQDIVDLQGDIVPIEEIEKSAYRYVIESRKGGDMHTRVAKSDTAPLHTSDMIESFVVTPEKLEKMGLPADALPHGWWVGYHVNDDKQWDMVKSGERAGFSIHGKGTRTPVSKSDRGVKERTRQAAHPPAVKLHPVKSSAISSMGYQPQTKRLAYEMRSRPGQPYLYKVKASKAVDALMAPSLGSHYATQIRGKAKRAERYTPADRVRLFADPQED